MPYLKPEDRRRLDDGDGPNTTGELNYRVTQQAIDFLDAQPKINYATISAAISALEEAAAEMRRRLLAPLEDKKIEENGDVYPDWLLYAARGEKHWTNLCLHGVPVSDYCDRCAPPVKEIDPELERLLDEEEAIERRTRENAARCDQKIHVFNYEMKCVYCGKHRGAAERERARVLAQEQEDRRLERVREVEDRYSPCALRGHTYDGDSLRCIYCFKIPQAAATLIPLVMESDPVLGAMLSDIPPAYPNRYCFTHNQYKVPGKSYCIYCGL